MAQNAQYTLNMTLYRITFIFFVSLLQLSACTSPKMRVEDGKKSKIEVKTYPFTETPALGQTPYGDTIHLGGFSGLHFEGVNAQTGRLKFITVTDRGPNPAPIDVPGRPRGRPFVFKDFTPRWVRFELDRQTGDLTITEQILLKKRNSKLMTGLPNKDSALIKNLSQDETPIDLRGNRLPFDPQGVDLEGIVQTPDKNYWLVEEYGPSLLEFSKEGRLLQRIVPQGQPFRFGKPLLPRYLNNRAMNRGFEGVSYNDGHLYAFIQSPLLRPDEAPTDKPTTASVIEWDPAQNKVTGQYTYTFESSKSDKIGDAVAIGPNQFLVIEQNSKTGPEGIHNLFRLDLRKYDNDPSKGIFSKTRVANLVALGVDSFEKLEGLTVIDDHTVAIISDNDFNLDGPLDIKTGRLGFLNPPRPQALIVLKFPRSLRE